MNPIYDIPGRRFSRGTAAYWSFAATLIALVVIASSRLQLKNDAVAQEVDGHLFGECSSLASVKIISYCSGCRTQMLRDSENAGPAKGYEVERGKAIASSSYPYWAGPARGSLDDLYWENGRPAQPAQAGGQPWNERALGGSRLRSTSPSERADDFDQGRSSSESSANPCSS